MGVDQMRDLEGFSSNAAGHAALAVCESMLLALVDLKLLTALDVVGALEDAAAVHRGTTGKPATDALHREVVVVIERIIRATRSGLPL